MTIFERLSKAEWGKYRNYWVESQMTAHLKSPARFKSPHAMDEVTRHRSYLRWYHRLARRAALPVIPEPAPPDYFYAMMRILQMHNRLSRSQLSSLMRIRQKEVRDTLRRLQVSGAVEGVFVGDKLYWRMKR
jgi:hypothetical protein